MEANIEQVSTNINQIAIQVAEKVSSGLEIKIALIAAVGVILGALVTIFGQLIVEWYKNKAKAELEESRKNILKGMLNELDKGKWRNISTLSSVIGADEEETKRLLIGIGARGSTGEKDVWGLISKNPLSDIK